METLIEGASIQDGDTVNLAAGTYSGVSSISISNEIKIVGAGKASTLVSTTVDSSTVIFLILADNVEISDMSLSGSAAIIQTEMEGFILHDIEFNSNESDGSKNYGVYLRGTTGNEHITGGLIYSCVFNNTQVLHFGTAQNFTDSDGTGQHSYWALPLGLGSAIGRGVVVVEDCTFSMTSTGNVIDCSRGGSFVVRGCDITSPGTGYIIEVHGVQSDVRGGKKWEVYNNILTGASKVDAFMVRAGTGVIFGNTLAGSFSNQNIIFDCQRAWDDVGPGYCNGSVTGWDGNEGSGDSAGYPCRDQIGRGPDDPQWDHDPVGSYTQDLLPAYIFSNLETDGESRLSGGANAGSVYHVIEDQDFFNENTSGHSASVGVNVGTRAQMDALTPTALNVGFWVTDEADWNNSQAGYDGQLYRSVSDGLGGYEWELYYTPYTYPHPLRGEGAGHTVTLSGPHNLTIDAGPYTVTVD